MAEDGCFVCGKVHTGLCSEAEEHVCDWRILLVTPDFATARIKILCRMCKDPLLLEDAEARINAAGRLSIHTARRSAEYVLDISGMEDWAKELQAFADAREGK